MEGQAVPPGGYRKRVERGVALLFLAGSGRERPPPRTPFLGTWATADNDRVTIRQDTIVQTQPDGQTTALDQNNCHGLFRFGYDTQSRQALTDLIPRQPDLRKKLSDLLV